MLVLIGIITGVVLWAGHVVPGWAGLLIIIGVILLGRAARRRE